jgi:hypothetical protein
MLSTNFKLNFDSDDEDSFDFKKNFSLKFDEDEDENDDESVDKNKSTSTKSNRANFFDSDDEEEPPKLNKQNNVTKINGLNSHSPKTIININSLKPESTSKEITTSLTQQATVKKNSSFTDTSNNENSKISSAYMASSTQNQHQRSSSLATRTLVDSILSKPSSNDSTFPTGALPFQSATTPSNDVYKYKPTSSMSGKIFEPS